MKTTLIRSSLRSLIALGLMSLAAGCSRSAPEPENAVQESSGTEISPATVAAAIAAYPLETCVVSGEKLGGSMGPAFDYLHPQEGGPDRLVRFCCSACIDEFKGNSAKYLALIDAAAALPKTPPPASQ